MPVLSASFLDGLIDRGLSKRFTWQLSGPSDSCVGRLEKPQMPREILGKFDLLT